MEASGAGPKPAGTTSRSRGNGGSSAGKDGVDYEVFEQDRDDDNSFHSRGKVKAKSKEAAEKQVFKKLHAERKDNEAAERGVGALNAVAARLWDPTEFKVEVKETIVSG